MKKFLKILLIIIGIVFLIFAALICIGLFVDYDDHIKNGRYTYVPEEENKGNELVVCDSAEPKSIAELQEYGISAMGAKKGPDSVVYGMKWLQDLEEIVIDPKRCPMTAKEFTEYELESDGNGGWKAYFPDRNNHAIDAVRYSRERDMRPVRIW